MGRILILLALALKKKTGERKTGEKRTFPHECRRHSNKINTHRAFKQREQQH